MRRMLSWPMLVVAVLAAASIATVGWGVHDLARAHDCLNNGHAATITEHGCELRTGSRSVLIPLNGPDFGITLLAATVGVVLLITLAILTVVRTRRVRRCT